MTDSQAQKLIRRVNEYFEVDLMKRSRARHLVDVRHTFMTSLRKRGYKTTDIGRYLGKDHATVIHASRKVKELCDYDKDMKKLVEYMDDLVDDFFATEKIYSKGSFIDKYESNRIVASRLIDEYVKDHKEIINWLDRFGISYEEFKAFTSRQL